MTTVEDVIEAESTGTPPSRRRRHYGRHIAGLQLLVLGLPWILLWLLWPTAPQIPRRERTAPGRVAFVRFQPGQNLTYLMPDLFSRGQDEQPDDRGRTSRSVPTLGDSLGPAEHSLAWEPVPEFLPETDALGGHHPFKMPEEGRGPTPVLQAAFPTPVSREAKLEIVTDGSGLQGGFDLSEEARLVLSSGPKSWHCNLRVNIVSAPRAVHVLVERSSGYRVRDRQVVSAVRQALLEREAPVGSSFALQLRYLAP